MTQVILKTNKGDVELELDDATPATTANFLDYVKSGAYNNTIFHRVIDNFMVQGGGFEPGMTQKATQAPIENEAHLGGKNVKGSIAMARTSDPHSATAQFFINVSDNDFLNFRDESVNGWGYCVFGKVISGMDVIDIIKSTPTTSKAGHDDVPTEDIIITDAVIKNAE